MGVPMRMTVPMMRVMASVCSGLWCAARLGAAVAAFHLQGDMDDVEAVVQQGGERVAQAVAVGCLVDDNVRGERRGAGGQRPDV